ncbi:MAG: ComEC/Rec2 family competence protein [Brumimicrobium sp.]
MILQNHVFKLLTAFCFGVYTSFLTETPWIISFTIWAIVVLCLLVLVYFGRKNSILRKWIGFALISTFFCSGILGYASHVPKYMTKHYSKYFLPNDQLIGDVIEFEKGQGDYDKLIFQVDYVVNSYTEFKVEGEILCYVKKNVNGLEIGDKLLLDPKLNPIENKNNPGEFDAESYWKTQGISEITFLKSGMLKHLEKGNIFNRFWYSSREYFKSKLKKYLSDENYAVATALTLGDKSSLSKESREIYANAGAMHVLAVSGMHVGILLGFLQWIFYKVSFMRKRNLYIYFALVIVWCFAFLTGLSSSVFRASIMFTILAIGQLRGYSFFSLNALLFSALILLIIDPFYLFNIGFQLSFLAMAGIVFFYKPINSVFTIQNRWINYLWEGTAIGIAAQIGTVPISLYYFNQFPNYFIITNIGLIILAAAALIVALLFFVLHLIPFVDKLIGLVVDYTFSVLNGFVSWVESLPYAVSTGFNPSAFHVLFIYIAVVGLLFFYLKRQLVKFVLASAVVLILSIGLILNRENNKSLNELVVFNNYKKIVAVKKATNIYCFYNADEENSLKKVEFIVEGYAKQMGSEIDYIPVNRNKEISLNDFFSLKSRKSGWEVSYHNNNLLLANGNSISSKLNDLTYVKGEWFPYISDEKVDISTMHRALRVDIFSDKRF